MKASKEKRLRLPDRNLLAELIEKYLFFALAAAAVSITLFVGAELFLRYQPFQHRVSALTLERSLANGLETYAPSEKGPFPAVLLFHGCGRDREHQRRWAARLAESGFLAVIVDSYSPRGIVREEDIGKVCDGKLLRGAERAADIIAARAVIASWPEVRQDSIALMGWSHGAWSVMDLLTYLPADSLPGLSNIPTSGLAGVRAIVLAYPYCGIAAQSHYRGWALKPPTLWFDTETDSVVGTGRCTAVFGSLSEDGVAVTRVLLHNVDHGFDIDVLARRTFRKISLSDRIATDKMLTRTISFLRSRLNR